MGTRKLEFKEICGYLPYILKGIAFGHNYKQVVDMSVIASDFMILETTFVYSFTHPKAKAIPLLRPLSDLYKTITHNGKEIVPIVECAKIFIEGLDWKLGKTINNYSYCAKYEDWYFDFNGRFMYYDEESNYEISNDWKLYDYLHELKIDYRGLIDAGLAVDVNTLNENPYK